MRVIVDANVFLSYLLHPQRPTGASLVVTHAIANDFDLVFPKGIAVEIRKKVAEKPFFRERIAPNSVEALLSLIDRVSVEPSLDSRSPVSSRDPDDQYLLDAAMDGVEFLVTGDRDLLDDAGKVAFTLIVSPAQFLSLFDPVPATDD